MKKNFTVIIDGRAIANGICIKLVKNNTRKKDGNYIEKDSTTDGFLDSLDIHKTYIYYFFKLVQFEGSIEAVIEYGEMNKDSLAENLENTNFNKLPSHLVVIEKLEIEKVELFSKFDSNRNTYLKYA